MSLVSTLAQNFRVDAPEFDKNEFRITQAGVFDTFKMQSDSATSFVTPELRSKALASMGRSLKIPAINYKDVTIRSTRPLTIAADENTSAFYTVSWTTVAYGFVMYPTQHFNNDISYQKDWNAKYKAMLVKMISTLEGLGVTALDAVKNQVTPELVGGHTFSSNVLHETGIANLASSYITGDLDATMRSNDFYPFNMDVVGNQGYSAVLSRLDGFSAANTENKVLQYGGKNFHFSNSITNASGKSATGYAIPEGSLGLLTRVEPDSLLRTSVADGHQWDSIVLPGLELPVGTYYYEAAVDASSVAGGATSHLTRSKAQYFDFAFDIAFVTPYNSDLATVPSAVLKFDIATA